uniref:Phycoerythrin alpha-subunit 1-4 n=1 Tax=Rhodomonas minuta TaxID=1326779 RepID=A0A067YS84_9CRYP|nr:phycoerythrin alpha-subunit 1-4 [Rhodomonas minuta]
MDKSARAPAITILDHRGCTAHENKEYKGDKSNDQDDEMCVVVRSNKVTVSEGESAKFLQQVISYQAKGIDGPYTGVGKK